MSAREDMIRMLEAVKDEKACLSCYLHPIQTYLDRRLWLHVCVFPLHPELRSAGTQFWQAAAYAMTDVATYQNFQSQRVHPRGTASGVVSCLPVS
eukprot:s14848_g1.t1